MNGENYITGASEFLLLITYHQCDQIKED